jgi:hypothetical protein
MTDALMIAVHGRENPTQAEVEAMLELARSPHVRATIVFSDGGALDAGARKRLKEAIGTRQVPAAIMHDSPVVRAMVWAVHLFLPLTRGFKPDEVREAFEFMKVPRPADFDARLFRLRAAVRVRNDAPTAARSA